MLEEPGNSPWIWLASRGSCKLATLCYHRKTLSGECWHFCCPSWCFYLGTFPSGATKYFKGFWWSAHSFLTQDTYTILLILRACYLGPVSQPWWFKAVPGKGTGWVCFLECEILMKAGSLWKACPLAYSEPVLAYVKFNQQILMECLACSSCLSRSWFRAVNKSELGGVLVKITENQNNSVVPVDLKCFWWRGAVFLHDGERRGYLKRDWKGGEWAVGSKAGLKSRIAYIKGCVGGRPAKPTQSLKSEH